MPIMITVLNMSCMQESLLTVRGVVGGDVIFLGGSTH